MKNCVISVLAFLFSCGIGLAADLFVEAENFSNKGGWKVDQQFMDLMGSHPFSVPTARTCRALLSKLVLVL